MLIDSNALKTTAVANRRNKSDRGNKNEKLIVITGASHIGEAIARRLRMKVTSSFLACRVDRL